MQFIVKSSIEERVIVSVELFTFKTPSYRPYFPAILKVGKKGLNKNQFLYDADILNEDVILKWNEKPLKHRFSCLTEKYLGELHEVTEPLITWLMQE